MNEFQQITAAIKRMNAVSELLRREREVRLITLERMEAFHAQAEADRITADLAYQRWKDAGGPQAANDERALKLQQRYKTMENF